MKFENTEVFNIKGALHGMRAPMNSYSKSDTTAVEIGSNDMDLAQRLIKGGSEHRKFLRAIYVSVDITAPQYWFAEFDTYKVGTTRNSSSFMHKGVAKPFEIEDFAVDNPDDVFWGMTINHLNELRDQYLATKDYEIFRQIRQLLPMGYLYRSTVTMNYEVIRTMYHQRKNHRLKEWSEDFVAWVKTLPYAEELIIYEG